MISVWQHPTRNLKLTFPTLLLALAIGLDAVPLPHSGPSASAPLFSLMVIYFWLIYRPELMNPAVIFLACLVLDAFSDLPLGMTALAFLITYAVLMPRDRSLSTSPFIVIWLCFAIASAMALGLRWGFASLWWSRIMPLPNAIFEWMLTALFYPIVGLVLSFVLLQMPKIRHASGK